MHNNFVIYFHNFFQKLFSGHVNYRRDRNGSREQFQSLEPLVLVPLCLPARLHAHLRLLRVCDGGDSSLGLISYLYGRQDCFLFRKVI